MKRMAVVSTVAIALWLSGCTRMVNQIFDLAPMEYRVEVEQDVMTPMRDGVQLASDLYKPKGLDRGPAILVRTPYGKRVLGDQQSTLTRKLYRNMARHGYFVMVQDTRGRYHSEGDFYPFTAETADGHDTVAWLAKQPWCNGKIGMWGGSYFGYTQWASADGSGDLDAMVPMITSAEIGKTFYEGGALNYLNMLGWNAMNSEHEGEKISMAKIVKAMLHLPLIDADDVAAGHTSPLYDDMVTYRAATFTDLLDYDDRFSRVKAPSYNICGWYDLFQKHQIEDFKLLLKEAEEPARSMSKIVIGPWGHGPFQHSPMKFPEGGVSKMPQLNRVMDFYDQLLKGEDKGVEDWAPWRIYLMGANEWRDYQEWPPDSVTPTSFYLASGGKANSAKGDGTLEFGPAEGAASDTFVYDPAKPVITAGGPLLGPMLGPKVQKSVEKRDDVLVYTTAPLEVPLDAPLTAMGKVEVVLYAASDAPDTDFTAKLCDVYPNGKSINIVDGIVRARFRNGDLTNPEFIEPGKVYEYHIDLWYTAYEFKPGHRIRVQISSSNFPRFDRNLNTGGDIATGVEMRKATQTIYHDAERPSRLVLEVVE